MSTILASSSLFPFTLYRMFGEDRGFPVIFDLYEGTRPDKTAIEAADVYQDGSTGWMDAAKWDAYIQTTLSQTVVRRFVLDDFSKNIVPQNETTLRFGFGNRGANEYKVDGNVNNINSSGTLGWFAIRGVSADYATQHYVFTGDISDLDGSGELKFLDINVTESMFIKPSSVTIDLGSLTVQ